MAYRIEYGRQTKPKRSGQGWLWRLQTMTAAFLLLFTMLVSRLWPEGREKLREYLMPRQDVIQTAFQQFTSELRAGESLEESLTTFCREIIAYGRAD